MCFSLVGFLFVPKVSRNSIVEEYIASPVETLKLAFTDTRTGLAVPLTLCNGMMMGFFFSEYYGIFYSADGVS